MKFFTLIALLFSSTLFAQENPWENKNKENPWETEEKHTEEKQMEEIENDSSIVITVNEVKDSVYVAKDTVYENTTAYSEKELYRMAKDDATKAYDSKRDFGAGFASGLVLNVNGVFVDLVYSMPTTEKEKAAINSTTSDTLYQSLDQEILERKIKTTVKTKKAGTAILGTMLGSLTQAFIALIIINSF